MNWNEWFNVRATERGLSAYFGDFDNDDEAELKELLREAMESIVPETRALDKEFYTDEDCARIDGFRSCEQESLDNIHKFFED